MCAARRVLLLVLACVPSAVSGLVVRAVPVQRLAVRHYAVGRTHHGNDQSMHNRPVQQSASQYASFSVNSLSSLAVCTILSLSYTSFTAAEYV